MSWICWRMWLDLIQLSLPALASESESHLAPIGWSTLINTKSCMYIVAHNIICRHHTRYHKLLDCETLRRKRRQSVGKNNEDQGQAGGGYFCFTYNNSNKDCSCWCNPLSLCAQCTLSINRVVAAGHSGRGKNNKKLHSHKGTDTFLAWLNSAISWSLCRLRVIRKQEITAPKSDHICVVQKPFPHCWDCSTTHTRHCTEAHKPSRQNGNLLLGSLCGSKAPRDCCITLHNTSAVQCYSLWNSAC